MSEQKYTPTDVVEALIREYLKLNNLNSTLDAFDSERPRSDKGIKRSDVLRKVVGLETVASNLKRVKPDQPLPPALHMWAEYTLEKALSAEAPSTGTNSPASIKSLGSGSSSGLAAAHEATAYMQRVRMDDKAITPTPAMTPSASKRYGHTTKSADSLVMEDLDDQFDDDPVVAVLPTLSRGVSTRVDRGTSVPLDQVRQLRGLLWGGLGQPPPSWKQGFFFGDRPGLQFGLVQRAGGPCGVLAALQAHILAALYNGERFSLSPNWQQQQAVLADAITASLWQAGGSLGAHLVSCSEGSTQGLTYDMLGRTLMVHVARTREELKHMVVARLSQLMELEGFGLVLFLFSVLLSRGLDQVANDMDVPGNSLMGTHGYCSMELVNLILSGAAVSNVFDGNHSLDEAVLKGIQRPSKMGLLTLFEWYKYVEVGRNYKEPSLPIWVIQSESHFTILFAADGRAAKNSLPFVLHFYDGLANQDAIIKLTITRSPTGGWTKKMGSTVGDRGKSDGHNIPPLELVVETRWPGVHVDWNGSEPIL